MISEQAAADMNVIGAFLLAVCILPPAVMLALAVWDLVQDRRFARRYPDIAARAAQRACYRR